MNTPPVLTVIAPPSTRFRDESDNVCVPLDPPTAMKAPENVTSSVTVYVPASATTTESLDSGTRPRLQLPGALHSPPAAFVHEFATSAPPADTVRFTVAFEDPLVIVTVAAPGDTASISPSADTVATAGLFDAYVIVAHELTSVDDASRASGWICAWLPTSMPPRFAGTPGAMEPDVAAKTFDTVSAFTTGGVNTAVLIRVAADNPTENRATCCASMMFTLPSPVTSPCAAMSTALKTGSPTEKRAICCASMMFTTESLFVLPQLPGAATHTSRLRTRTRGRILALATSPAAVGFSENEVLPGVVDAVKNTSAIVTVLVVPPAALTESPSVPPPAPDVFGVNAPNPAPFTESNTRRFEPHTSPVASEARFAPPADDMSMAMGILTGAPGVT